MFYLPGKGDQVMRINLDEAEIHQALKEFVENQGIPLVNKTVEVTMKAGRGKNGYKAQVVISAPDTIEVGDQEPEEAKEDQQALPFFKDEEKGD
jgi:hypothetical protein